MEQALALDAKNVNTFRANAIAKEMENVKVAFKIIPDWEKTPTVHQSVGCHMVFDIKMEDFKFKASLVTGGQMTKASVDITYASVVFRQSVNENSIDCCCTQYS